MIVRSSSLELRADSDPQLAHPVIAVVSTLDDLAVPEMNHADDRNSSENPFLSVSPGSYLLRSTTRSSTLGSGDGSITPASA